MVGGSNIIPPDSSSHRLLAPVALLIFFVLIVLMLVNGIQLANAEGRKKDIDPAKKSSPIADPSPEVVEHEKMLFDLYLGDTMKGRIFVEYTESSFRLPTPQDVLEQMPMIKDSAKVLDLISGDIPGVRTVEGVGKIAYNLQTFQILLTLDPALLYARELDSTEFLPSPDAGFSWQQTVRLDTAGTVQDDMTSSLGFRTLTGYKKAWANADAALINAQTNDYEISSLSGSAIARDLQFDLGLLRTDGQFLASGVEIAGLKIHSSQDVYLNNDMRTGSRLEVFVPSRARVDCYREDRLISSSILEYGLQQIDTTDFPQGSYPVEIVITADDGSTNREHRFFTKSGMLAAIDRPAYNFELGALRDKLEVEEIPIFQSGVALRATDWAQIQSSIYGSDDIQSGALETLALWREFILSAGYLHSTENDSAATLGLSGDLLSLSFSLQGTKTLSGYSEDSATDFFRLAREREIANSPSADTANKSNNPDDFFYSAQESCFASITKSFADFDISFSANNSRSGHYNPRHSLGGYLTWHLLRDATNWLSLQTSYYDTEEGDKIRAQLNYTYRFENWSYTGAAVSSGGETDELHSLGNTFAYDGRSQNQLGSAYSAANRLKTEKKQSGSDKSRKTSMEHELDLKHTGRKVRVKGNVKDERGGDSDQTAVSFGAEASMLLQNDFQPVFSSPKDHQAVLIAEIKSSTTESEVELVVDGQSAGLMKSGATTVVGIAPFKTYTIGIRPTVKSDLMYYDTQTYTATVFPGNILKYSWVVEKVYVAIGRVVREDGSPVTWARLHGLKEYAVTEEDGSFQAEVSGSEKLYLEDRGSKCQIVFPPREDGASSTIVDYGDVVCSSESSTQASPKEQESSPAPGVQEVDEVDEAEEPQGSDIVALQEVALPNPALEKVGRSEPSVKKASSPKNKSVKVTRSKKVKTASKKSGKQSIKHKSVKPEVKKLTFAKKSSAKKPKGKQKKSVKASSRLKQGKRKK